ncbi:Mitotic exit network component [Malassezia nana]|uniref:Mitotic exit network component n=1 Tax=Malassezia nana TaxID=180528 RepID=A0AAF0EMU0_9BASI|nr:Mitotic exit network component [Malassezia nana]
MLGQLKRLADSTLGSGNLRVAVQVPDGELLEEWLAVHTVDFFNHLNILYGTLTELCTPRECPVMCAGPRFEYHWQDPTSVKYRRSTRLSAPDYIECLLNWTQAQMDDEQLFPVQPGAQFPPQFVDRVKAILRRLFRIYAHVYHHHFAQVCAMRLETHLNTSYRHFFLFVTEYHLIDPKEMVPLAEINEAILDEQARQSARS